MVLIPEHIISPKHWCLCIIYMQEKRIVYLDSLNNNCKDSPRSRTTMTSVLRYLKDLHRHMKKKTELNFDEWKLEALDVNQQENGIDCGIFVNSYAECAVLEQSFDIISQKSMSLMRNRIALSLIQGFIV